MMYDNMYAVHRRPLHWRETPTVEWFCPPLPSKTADELQTLSADSAHCHKKSDGPLPQSLSICRQHAHSDTVRRRTKLKRGGVLIQ